MIKTRKNLFLSTLGLTMYSLLGLLSLVIAMEEAESKTSGEKARTSMPAKQEKNESTNIDSFSEEEFLKRISDRNRSAEAFLKQTNRNTIDSLAEGTERVIKAGGEATSRGLEATGNLLYKAFDGAGTGVEKVGRGVNTAVSGAEVDVSVLGGATKVKVKQTKTTEKS